jgi:3-hydroxyacyl-CoA dehydrogenase/enoyl-CoA hydratase/3-hydroxybutyryl-CoA epimerase
MTEETAIRWEKGEDGVVVLTLDDPSQSANTMNALYQASMQRTVARLVAEKDTLKGVIVTSAKKTFFAGGDLKMLVKAAPADAPELFRSVRELTAQLRALETLGKPVVAALNGSALGGGLEIALACHYRVAIDDGKSEFGLPEVTLGLLPGGGGVVRTVRLFGVQKALLEVLLEGPRMKPAQAKAKGLVDELVPDRAAMMARARAFIAEHPTSQQPWDAPGYRMPGGTPKDLKLAANLPAFPANLRKQLKGANYPAPLAILSAAVEGAAEDFETASKIESRYFVGLATGEVSKNMTKAFFFDLGKINSGASRPGEGRPGAAPTGAKHFARWAPKKVGILGAGMMGQGIAYATAMAGIEVVLKDVSVEGAEKGKAYSAKLLEKRVGKGAMAREKADAALALIKPTASAEDLAGCDMIIEAVFENRELKAKVTAEAEAKGAPGLLMCSNTSTLPITGLAKASKAPERFIGLHFFSPVDKMPLVEIIVGEGTSDEALAQAFDYVAKIRKTPIVVNDSRGFFTSRVFGTFAREGVAMLAEGLNPMSIEQAATQSGMPVGPLAVNDEVSLELVRHVREQTKEDLEAEGKPYEAHPSDPVIDALYELGRKGKAHGAGFYEYPASGKKHLWPGLVERFVKPEGNAPSDAMFADMKDRLLYVQSLETVRCLEEGVLRSVADANIGSIMGIGAPPWTGGLLQYVNYVGLPVFVARSKELAARYGARFEPPKLLVEMAAAGKTFE